MAVPKVQEATMVGVSKAQQVKVMGGPRLQC
jgi:hypothetical protein